MKPSANMAGLGFSVTVGCANNDFSCTVGISVGAIACAVLDFNHLGVCSLVLQGNVRSGFTKHG